MVRSAYSDVTPGSKTDGIVQQMMQPAGCTRSWAVDVAGIAPNSFGPLIRRLPDMTGYDIRAFKHPRTGKTGRQPYIYRIVGRYKWDGGYESYIDPEDYA